MIEHEPKASRMMEKYQRKNDGEGNPKGELLMDRHGREGVQDEKAGDGNRNGGRVIHINRADKVTLLPFKLETAVKTAVMHRESAVIQSAHTAARALETHRAADHRQNSMSHVKQSLVHKAPASRRGLIPMLHQ
jgi:hypothetical protein